MREQLPELLPGLKRFAYALTGARADADDLLQATVERLLRRPPPADADLSRWAFRVCRNLWIDETRSRKVRNHAPASDDLKGAPYEDGETAMINHVTLSEVNLAMQSLPGEQRAALALVAVEGMTYARAAEVLEVPIGTIMSRVARARRGLANVFEPAPECSS
ncbi:MAG: RNA polymerase sigma factor [Pseudomonadota bacterium]